MKNYIYIGIAAILTLLLLTGACGKRSSPARTVTGPPIPEVAVGQNDARQPAEDVFTEEDYMLMAMSLEDRIEYLEQKFKDMMLERYGIVIDESVSTLKGASLVDPFHKVCKTSGVDNKEEFDLVQTTSPSNKWKWTLSFYQRLSGDYDFDNVVTLDDIYPIGANFGHKKGDEWYDLDARIDRLANEDGEISIADITPLAINFGYSMDGHLDGYNVYWQDSTGGDWKLIADRSDGVHNSSQNAPDDWSFIFTKKSIYRDTSPPVTIETSSGSDLIRVKPVFSIGEQDIPSETDTFDHAGSNTAPVADITADPTVADCGETVTFDASGSTDENEGDTLYYEWDFDNWDSWLWRDTGTTDTTDWAYSLPRTYTATVWVTDQVGDWSTDTVEVEVEYVPATEPPTVIEFTVNPTSATLPATIKFMTRAQDRDGDIIETIAFDRCESQAPDWDYTFDDEDEEFTVENPGAPDYEKVYKAEYDVTFNRSDEFIDDDHHTTDITCRTKVADDDENDEYTINITPLSLTHASPVINSVSLTNEVGRSEPNNPLDPVTVTIDASDSSDADGTNQFPTRFVFSFGDGSANHTESYGDQGFDGITTHPYNDPGVYQITVTCYDNDHTVMNGSCDSPSSHTHTYDWSEDEDEDGKVRIWWDPVVERNEVVDDGTGSDWVGIPCISVAVNPDTGWPGVVYSANPTINPGLPADVAKFSEKTAESGGWTTPEMVWTGSEVGEHLGYQCDLEYHPTVYSGDDQVPHVVQYFYNLSPDPGFEGGPGLKLYAKMNDSWDCNILVDDGTVYFNSPVRLVVNNMGSFVQFKGRDASEDIALNEIAFEGESSFTKNSYVQVQSKGAATHVGMSHDLKQYQDDYSGDADTRASLYTVDSSADDVQYEVWTGSAWTGSSPALNTENVDTGTSRHVALDYLGDSEIGAIWVDDDGDLKWAKYTATSWSSATELQATVGDWCDFDYEPTLEIPCVAYEEDEVIYLLVYYSGSWQDPVEVDQLNQGEVSHLDLDIHDGYIFIAYSHDDGIYCAVIDFYDR